MRFFLAFAFLSGSFSFRFCGRLLGGGLDGVRSIPGIVVTDVTVAGGVGEEFGGVVDSRTTTSLPDPRCSENADSSSRPSSPSYPQAFPIDGCGTGTGTTTTAAFAFAGNNVKARTAARAALLSCAPQLVLLPATAVWAAEDGGVSALASAVSSSSSAAAPAAALEVESLPDPLLPVLFSVALLVGVGLLTGSLGDVVAEEALLGDRSGARAKKEQERSRRSFFKDGGER